MRRALSPRLTSVFALALVLTGCGSASEPPGDSDPTSAPAPPAQTTTAPLATPTLSPSQGKSMSVTMTGTIEEGVESGCLVFTDEATEETYSVTADQLAGAALDSRVTVTGTVDPEMMSFCMQGPILLVDEVTPPTD